jgi:hypothetical protein
VTCEIPNSSKGTISLALPLTWKVAILLKQRPAQWSGNTLQRTMFYKKTNVDCGIIEKPTIKKMINWEWEECSRHKKQHIWVGMGDN